MSLVKFAGRGEVSSIATKKMEMLRKKYLPTPSVFILLDCSGSMSGNKLDQSKRGIAKFMEETENIGLITFSSSVQVVKTLNGVEADGSTNMADAVSLAVENLPRGGRRVIVIATDGMPDDPSKTFQIALSAKERGIKIICIGTDDADEKFLKELASRKDMGMKVPQKDFGRAIARSATLLLN